MRHEFLVPSHKHLVAANRFWNRVAVGKDDECWPWQAPLDSDGYGRFYLRTKSVPAHRASWIMHFDEIPEGMQVCHLCDNPSCVNPKHLFLGTNTDNMRDKTAKGRGNAPHGSVHTYAKITEDMVASIRSLARDSSITYAEIGARFGITSSNVCMVAKGTTWAHVDDALEHRRPSRRQKLTAADVIEMRRLHADGVSNADLARQFAVSFASVSLIVRHLNWRHI